MLKIIIKILKLNLKDCKPGLLSNLDHIYSPKYLTDRVFP